MAPDDTPANDSDESEKRPGDDPVSETSEIVEKNLVKNVGPPRRLIAPQVVLIVAGLVVCASAWFAGIFAGHNLFFSANHVLYFEPLSRYIGEALREGRIPLWNPYCYSGMSQIANLTPSPFYPFTALFAVLDYNRAVALSIVIHELIGLGGTYLLLRSIGTSPGSETSSGDTPDSVSGTSSGGYSRMACLAGSLVFMFCGCLQPGPANFTIAATAAWIPWCFWAQLRLQRATGRAGLAGGVAVLAIVAAMNMLAGCIELSMLTMGLVKLNVILDAVKRFRSGIPWIGNALRQWCALFIGTLIAAPALLPATEWLIDKFQYPVSVAAANRADFVTTLLGFLYPVKQSNGFTIIANLLIDGKGTGEIVAVDHVITCFGPIVLGLAIYGLSRHRRILIGAAIVGTAGLCLISLRTLDLPLARFLPSAYLCHPTAPFMVLMSLAVAFAIAEGTSDIEAKYSRYSLLAVIAVVLSLVPCSFFNVDAFCQAARNIEVVFGPNRSKEFEKQRVAISARWAIPQLVAGPNEQVPETFTTGKEANRNIDDKLLNAYGYQSTPSSVYQYVIVGKKFVVPNAVTILTDATIIASPKVKDLDPNAKYPVAAIERRTYDPASYSRCTATIDWSWKDSPTQAIDALRDESLGFGTDFIERNTAQGKDTEKLRELPSGLLNPPPEAPSKSPEGKVVPVAGEKVELHGKVKLTQSEPEHAVISVVLDKPAFVILRDAFYPGWKVSVDAIPTVCYRSNGILRGVYVDKGAHLVQFDFKPDSYALGLKCFVMGLAIFFYLAIWSIARLIVKTIRFMSYGVWDS